MLYFIVCVQGLESLVQKPTMCTSLVSDGAECIFISKRLFLSLANIKVLRLATDMVYTYIRLYIFSKKLDMAV